MMKKLLPFLFYLPLILSSCGDKCEKTQIVRQVKNVRLSAEEIRAGLSVENSSPLEMPGKIYIKDDYLFINEIKKGIHVFNNSNPSNPQEVAFIRIPGNGDLAVKGDILYADSYMDLVAIDISNPAQAKEVGRSKGVFSNGVFAGLSWNFTPQTGTVDDQEAYYLEETFQTNCEGIVPRPGGWWPIYGDRFYGALFNSATGSSYSGTEAKSAGAGTGGSMARFTIYDDFLYTVDQKKLQLLSISSPDHPSFVKHIELGWGVETIFPYQNKLFIGTNTGMHIFDNSTPADPKHLSNFTHIRACDPVVVHDQIAYVTLRSGTGCGGNQNRLELVDVSDLSKPRLMKSYAMDNPAGLSINYPNLFICEGKFGLKVFDVSAPYSVDKNLLAHQKGIEAYDVITLGKNVMMVGNDGLYQFDATDVKNLKRLSHIPVHKPALVVERK